jgi:hypothetical protein
VPHVHSGGEDPGEPWTRGPLSFTALIIIVLWSVLFLSHRELKRHMFTVEEKVLESLGWAPALCQAIPILISCFAAQTLSRRELKRHMFTVEEKVLESAGRRGPSPSPLS